MSFLHQVLLAVLVVTALWLLATLVTFGRREKGLPTGPHTVPIFGNLLDFPKEFAHYKLTEWAKTYGGIYSLKVASGTVIVLTSAEAIKELMDRRSASTADRPPNFMADRITDGKHMGFARYSEDWRVQRRAAHSILTPDACVEHARIQADESAQTLYDILHEPEVRTPLPDVCMPKQFLWHDLRASQRFYTHLRRNSISIIMSVLFGRRAPRFETAEVTEFFRVQELWEHALEPGAHPPVDILPILRLVPERWAPWKTLCREVRRLQRNLYFGLLEECERRLEPGDRRLTGCFMENLLQHQKELGLSRELCGYLGGILMEGGSDSTSFYLLSLVLAMVAYPDVQRKAHEEIDRVIGHARVPTLEDIPHLPYIQCIIKEVHRWRPVTPLGIPHSTLSDETYGGYLIPKGCTIFVNNWGIFHDERLFDNPDEFCPERFLKHELGVRDGSFKHDLRENMAFGYGRRVCPGRHLAQNLININAVRLIWAFNYGPAANPTTGLYESIDTRNYAKGILTGPMPFRAEIKPRNAQIADAVDREFAAARINFELYEGLLSVEDKDFILKTRTD